MSALSITGCGMVCSLGVDVATSCAAARAGIVRPEELSYYPVRSPEDGSAASAIGHPASLLADGFEGDARLLCLAVGALADLEGRFPRERWESKRVGVYVSVPDLNRSQKRLESTPDDIASGRATSGRTALAGNLDAEQNRGRVLWESIVDRCDWPAAQWFRYSTTCGHAGVARALTRAWSELVANTIDIALVGGVDSLLDEDTLAWLEETNRLKTPSNAVGFQPGEAAAFLILEKTTAVVGPRDQLARLSAVCLGEEPHTPFSDEPCTGSGLADLMCFNEALKSWRASGFCWIISDQNGEGYRANEWGNVVVRLAQRVGPSTQPLLWYPAASFGDTGAASGAVAMCVASRAFARKYAPFSDVGIVSTGETSARSVIHLTAAY